MSFQFAFNPNRCTGCQACVVGCWMENRQKQSQNWRRVHTFNAFHHPQLPLFHLSLACHHCEDPACLRNCPADAYAQDAVTGAVTIDAERCIGCRYCTWACPHDAPKFNAAQGTIEKCTFCSERIGQGLEPACATRCPVEALGFEERKQGDKHHDIPGFPASEIRPSIRFVPLRRDAAPDLGLTPDSGVMRGFLGDLLRVPEAKITLSGEWTLLLFTTAMSLLYAWFTSSLTGGPALPAPIFLSIGLVSMLLSAWHLGRRERAWRAILHLRTSWLSREILLTGAFLGFGGLHLLFLPQSKILGWATVLLGLAGLLAIDRIYRVALKGGRLHSGQTLLNGHYLLGLLSGLPLLSIGAGMLKIVLYLHRKHHFAQKGRPIRSLISALRLCLGFLGPLFLMTWNPLLAALSALLGDFVDRCEFYQELEIHTPELELNTVLRARLNP